MQWAQPDSRRLEFWRPCVSHLVIQQKTVKTRISCTNGYFYVTLGSSMGLALLVWVGGGLLKRV